ncbi:MAG: FAD-dependent oxidoreductase [Coriobacteriales bacterium]|jgi:fumarate reductase flavoprotein subunit|nr:FAD-dependent oxidoreductase [Coriobacteriales bacterium]
MADTSENKGQVSRRSFVAGIAGVSLGLASLAGGLTACSPKQENAVSSGEPVANGTPISTVPESVAESLDCDIVIVGAGISGLACAVQAAQDGNKVLVLEKGAMAGGNGIGTEGVFAIGSKMQLEQGIEITPSDIISAELEESQYRGDGSLWLNLCENSAGNIEWLQENGVKFSGIVDNYHTGLFATMHWFEESDGSLGGASYIAPMVATAERLGVEFRYEIKAYLLVQDAGQVTGLYAEDLATGEHIQVNARAVILASGGVGANPELLKRQGWQQRNIDEKISMCMPTVEGDGYLMAMAAGGNDYLAYSCDQAFIGIKALGTDTTPPYSSMLNGGNGIGGCGPTLWVNQDALRFNDESITHFNMAALEPACRGNRMSYTMFDQSIVDTFITDPEDLAFLNNAVADPTNSDSIVVADTYEALAENFGLDVETFVASVERYNSYCQSGNDLDFGKDSQFMVSLTNAPYYMANIVPLFVVLIGGIMTNIRAEVLGEELTAIPGLYAVGLDGAMMHKNVYTQNMPGSNMGNNVNAGRNAAKSATAYIKGV